MYAVAQNSEITTVLLTLSNPTIPQQPAGTTTNNNNSELSGTPVADSAAPFPTSASDMQIMSCQWILHDEDCICCASKHASCLDIIRADILMQQGLWSLAGTADV